MTSNAGGGPSHDAASEEEPRPRTPPLVGEGHSEEPPAASTTPPPLSSPALDTPFPTLWQRPQRRRPSSARRVPGILSGVLAVGSVLWIGWLVGCGGHVDRTTTAAKGWRTEATQTTRSASSRRQLQPPGQGPGSGPVKGDRDCDNFVHGSNFGGSEAFSPCLEDNYDQADDDDLGVMGDGDGDDNDGNDRNATGFFPGPEETAPLVPPRGPRPPRNVVDVRVFVGLDPWTRSVSHSVAQLLTQDMNATMENMNFYMDGMERQKDQTQGGTVGSSPVGQDDEDPTGPIPLEPLPEGPAEEDMEPVAQISVDSGSGGTPLGNGGGGGGARKQNRRPPPRQQRFNMHYLKTKSRLGRRNQQRWWWEYNVRYLCRWEASENPVLSDDLMKDIAANMTNNLDENELSMMLRNMTGNDNLVLKVFSQNVIPDPAEFDIVDFSDNEVPSFEQLDAQEWSWTRYLGFALFLTIVLGLVLTSQIGAFRRRRKLRQQVWGNLASEEGVKQLLNTGWVLRDDRMEVFDKARIGYRDDDSMLIGGYEQREPGPGTEIIAPTHTTHEDTSTRGASTALNRSSSNGIPRDFPDSAQSTGNDRPSSNETMQERRRRTSSGGTGPSMHVYSVQVCFLLIIQALLPAHGFATWQNAMRKAGTRVELPAGANSILDSSSYLSTDQVLERSPDKIESYGAQTEKSQHQRSRSTSRASRGLSRFHQSILSRTHTARQALVTGRDPVTLSFRESPTLKWLSRSTKSKGSRPSTLQLYVNGTVLEKSTASLERFLWLQEEADLDDGWDDVEPVTKEASHDYLSLEWEAEIFLERPGYVNVLPRECVSSSLEDATGRREWSWHARAKDDWQEEAAHRLPLPARDVLVCTGFSLSRRKGLLASIDTEKGEILRANDRTRSQLLWPNEVTAVPKDVLAPQWSQSTSSSVKYQDAVLVSDGFLVPGKDRGGLYLVRNPGSVHKEWTVRLTSSTSPWFYHKAMWMDLTNDGRQSILTARCRVTTKFGGRGNGISSTAVADQVTSGIVQQGELVWLEAPKPHSYDTKTGTPLEADGTIFDPFASHHLPWKEHVLAAGPDVMFCVADLDPSDDCVEVIASQFFDQSVRLYSVEKRAKPRVVFERDIDAQCGAAFASTLADLDQEQDRPEDHAANDMRRTVIDAGSTVPTLKSGDGFSHLLVTSHECTYAPAVEDDSSSATPPTGASLATDRSAIDGGSVFAYRVPSSHPTAWKTEPWLRTTVATGFTVRGQLGNVINPGAPGFCYTFPARQGDRTSRPLLAVAGDCAESAYIFRPVPPTENGKDDPDPSTRYRLMVEIECESTVGSIGVGYGDFMEMNQDEHENYAKLYVPCFEKDKILVFSLGRSSPEELDHV